MIDAHVHLWDQRRWPYPWLRRHPQLNLPVTSKQLRSRTRDGRSVVLIEAAVDERHRLDEARWFSELFVAEAGVHGFVAAVDLEDEDLSHSLDTLAALPGFVGIRSPVTPTALSTRRVAAALAELDDRDIVLDVCLSARELCDLLASVQRHPAIVVDHFGQPPSEQSGWGDWQEAIGELAENPSVYVKLSGSSAEPGVELPSERLDGLVDATVSAFGAARCLVGSDWPVTDPPVDLCVEILQRIDARSQTQVGTGTAIRVYRSRAAKTPPRWAVAAGPGVPPRPSTPRRAHDHS